MENLPLEDRIQERIQSCRRSPGCRTAFYLLATFVICEVFCRVAASYLLTERTIILSVCCMGGFLLHEIHCYVMKPPAGEKEDEKRSSEDPIDP